MCNRVIIINDQQYPNLLSAMLQNENVRLPRLPPRRSCPPAGQEGLKVSELLMQIPTKPTTTASSDMLNESRKSDQHAAEAKKRGDTWEIQSLWLQVLFEHLLQYVVIYKTK